MKNIIKIKIDQFVAIKGISIYINKYRISFINELLRTFKIRGIMGLKKEFVELMFSNEKGYTAKSGYHKVIMILGILLVVEPVK